MPLTCTMLPGLPNSVKILTMNNSITVQEILEQLDKSTEKYLFAILDNGYSYLITSRIKWYGDGNRWALIIETFGYNARFPEHSGATNLLHVYGNCLTGPIGYTDDDFLVVSADGPEGATFDEWYVNPEAKTITLRDKVIPFDLTPENLKRKGITLVDDNLSVPDLFRSLLPEFRESLLATEEKLLKRIPHDLDPSLYKVDKPANNHWSNWLEGGTL